MNTVFDALPADGARIVYVRPVAVVDLPAEIQAQAGALETLYALYRSDGERLALVVDKRMAFALAREHDLAPVSVH